MHMTGGRDAFMGLLERCSAELYADHPDLMDTSVLIPTPNEIHEDDVALAHPLAAARRKVEVERLARAALRRATVALDPQCAPWGTPE